MLNPQPQAAAVFAKLLEWMDRADLASQGGDARPAFRAADGSTIFPEDDEPWWLTEFANLVAIRASALASVEDGPDIDGDDDIEDALSEAEAFKVTELEECGDMKDPVGERQVTNIENLQSITSVIKDFDFFAGKKTYCQNNSN